MSHVDVNVADHSLNRSIIDANIRSKEDVVRVVVVIVATLKRRSIRAGKKNQEEEITLVHVIEMTRKRKDTIEKILLIE